MSMTTEQLVSVANTDRPAPAAHRGIAIEDATAWILRVGVVLSVLVMLTGMTIGFIHENITVKRMETARFEYHPSVIWQGIVAGQGKAIIELGIYLLVLTPIMRVVASVVLFAVEDHDWLYTIVTFVVLVLTLLGLLVLK
jgi:uncharacterized membrane protein